MMASFHRNSFKRGETRGSTKLLVTVVISLFLLTALAYLLCSRGNTPLWQRCFPGEHADNSTKKSVTYRTPPLFSPPLPQATKNESSTPSPLSSPNAIAITTAGPNVDGSDQTNNRLVQIIQKNFSDQLAKVAMLRLPEPKPEPKKKAKPARPIQFEKRTIDHVSFYQTTIDLNDPEMFIEIGLANNTEQANTQTVTFGDEHFASMLKRYPAAVVANGTFFAKDKFECIMGNMVSSGQRLKYSQWENYGTTLGLKAGNIPEMVTACEQGQPDWDSHWLSITCGPRLLKDGLVWLHPDRERFEDPHVLGIGPRSAIGYPSSKDKLYLITFLNGLSLDGEARMMKAIGCADAMNLDGGASKALAHNGSVVVTPGRNLTNIIVVYDVKNRAPKRLVDSWKQFQKDRIRSTL